MNGITILVWITIAIIAIIAIIVVKLHYRGSELEHDEGSILDDAKSINKVFSKGQSILSGNDESKSNNPTTLNQSKPTDLKSKTPSFNEVYEEPVALEVENNNYNNIEYKSQNQVLVDYGNTVEKFQEPIKQNQMDIMTQNNDPKNGKHELKDLFTIDELIKESKRKDSEREKELHKNDEEDEELTELKESIKQKQEEKNIEEIVDNLPEETIKDILDETEEEKVEEETTEEEKVTDAIAETTESEDVEIETPTVTSQDIEEAITTASQESEEKEESISENTGITDVLLNDNQNEEKEEKIKEPILKTPTKIESSKLANKNEDVIEEYDDLDYRKDLAKITNTIKGSKIFQDVKDKLVSEPEPPAEEEVIEESFIRNVNEYDDEFAPIINETHVDYEATYEDYHRADFDDSLRQRNSQNVFNMKETAPKSESKIAPIKDKPSRENIKIQLNNNEVVLKKGDEIIFNHMGETYSSQVYAINGDDISVKYRRKNITIKPSDVKKVY